MTMITPSYLGETIEYSSLHACRSTLEDPTKAGEPCFAGVVYEYVPRFEVLMYKATRVDLAECCRQANGDTQDASQIEQLAPLKNQIKGLPARVHEYEDRPPLMTS